MRFALIGLLGVNLLLYAGIWIYNVASGRPSRSRSGL